jgi:triosephosphate isomerase
MLKELGCSYVELNHQERRAYFNETNGTTNKKVRTALKFELSPILCLGEEEILPDAGVRSFLQIQINEMLSGVDPEKIPNIIFAYEPRWAIGKSDAAPVAHIRKVHGIIRSILSEKYGEVLARKTYIIYGGSVDLENAVEIAVQDGVDGLFIGRCGLKAKTFASIILNVAGAIEKL